MWILGSLATTWILGYKQDTLIGIEVDGIAWFLLISIWPVILFLCCIFYVTELIGKGWTSHLPSPAAVWDIIAQHGFISGVNRIKNKRKHQIVKKEHDGKQH
ncbi:unnamed protein product [marine sediment metagenome]|uniref:Uncharacterized protein n=1 Tax=marine sediment metagenome TaxID=412755 RepID=X0UE47_9ZZZZ